MVVMVETMEMEFNGGGMVVEYVEAMVDKDKENRMNIGQPKFVDKSSNKTNNTNNTSNTHNTCHNINNSKKLIVSASANHIRLNYLHWNDVVVDQESLDVPVQHYKDKHYHLVW